MQRDKSVYVLGEEVAVYGGAYKCTSGLLQEFGAARVVDMPISEIGFTGMAVGSAFLGLKPICEFMTFNFALQALDHIFNSAAKTLYMSGGRFSCPIVFRGPNGFSPGVAAQHTQDFSGMFCGIPGMKVVAPYTAADHVGLLRSAIRDPNPVVVLESEVLYPLDVEYAEEILGEEYAQPLNKSVVLEEGSDVTLIGMSVTVGLCLEAAKNLKKTNISAEVINLISINPLDMHTLEVSAEKTRRVIIVDFNWPECSVASEISSRLSHSLFGKLSRPIEILCAKKVPTPYAEELEREMYPSPETVREKAVEMVRGKSEK